MIKLKFLISEIRVEPRGYTATECAELIEIIKNSKEYKNINNNLPITSFVIKKGYGELCNKGLHEFSQTELNICYKLLLQFAKENNIKL